MLTGIISIALNILYVGVMFIDIYTDRFYLPGSNGEITERVIKRIPASRLGLMDNSWLVFLLMITAAVCIISSLLTVFGVKGRKLRYIQIGSLIAATVIFIITMIMTSHPTYTY